MFNAPPIIRYLREVLEENTILLEDGEAEWVKTDWLIDMIFKVEALYRKHGTL